VYVNPMYLSTEKIQVYQLLQSPTCEDSIEKST
jgi:hypothetical protein